jgi:signal transduction histidine kinase
VRGPDGEVQYSVSIAEDITERKKAEEERAILFELERIAWGNVEKLAAERAAILSQIADGIIIADPAGRISFINERARAIHGVAELGVPVVEYADKYGLLTMDGKPYPSKELPLARAVLHGETIVDAEWRVRRPDGTEIVAQGSATPVVGEDGTRLGAVLTVRDVTEQFNLERQKDDFLSAAAHDLRTPLTTIKGRVELLRRRADAAALEPERFLEDLRRIDASASRMVTLINELLDVANIQLGRPLALVSRPVDLVELARTVAAEQGASAHHHVIAVQTELPALVASLDATRIERALANLVSNAVKYSPDGGEITIGVEEALKENERRAVLWVRDQGIGIPADDLPYVFNRFHRGENVVGKIAGTGIGLAAVREIVERHEGTVSVQSREGEGTIFTVTLPL